MFNLRAIRCWLQVVVMTGVAAGCANVPQQAGSAPDPVLDALREAAEPLSAPPAPPPDVADALLPPMTLTLPPGGVLEERFDVNVNESPVRAFFSGLVAGTDTNLVVHPAVAGTISLTMKNVTIADVLEILQQVYGFDIRTSGSGYVVMPPSLQSRIFQVDYLDMQRSGVSRMRVSSGQVSQGNGQRNSSSVQSSDDTRSQGGNSDRQSVTGSRIDTTYSADFWSDLEQSLNMIVDTGVGRQVVVNSQTGVLMVRAMPDELRSVEAYLQTVQATAQRQVLLEAKVVEVALHDGFQAGVNWVAVANTASGKNFTFGQTAPPGGGGFRNDINDVGGAPITVAPGSQVGGFDSTSLGGAFTMAFDVGDFNAFIELLEVQGDTRVLSSPRVATLNNQKAVIKAGTDEFFVTDVSSNTVTGTSSTTSRDVELTPFFSGIALDVTPQISADGVVTLHIHPTVSEVTDQEKDLTISGETDRLPLAVSEIRESDTVVRARSGQIIVIGGLMRDSSTDESFGTPLLGKLPGVGGLFRSTRRVSRKSELVILLKPVVVDQDRIWSEAASQSLDTIRGMTEY